MPKAMLIDIRRCMGCRSCQVACKRWKNIPAEQTAFSPNFTNPKALSPKTLSNVSFHSRNEDGVMPAWNFVKRQCMHCNVPSCATICPTNALQKTDEGPVVYTPAKCIGCKLCTKACPFSVPKFGWGKTLSLIQKCNLCYDRISAGMQPACASTCPNNAIMFGERDELIKEARRRIKANPDKYVNHIYGENEAGGSAVLYISSVPFEELGFRADIGDEPLPTLKGKAVSKTSKVVPERCIIPYNACIYQRGRV